MTPRPSAAAVRPSSWIAGLVLLLVAGGAAVASRGADAITRDDLKAAFIYRFTAYMKWPREDPTRAFVIAVVGSSGSEAALRRIAATKLVGGARPIEIRAYESVAELERCDVLFLAADSLDQLPDVLERVDREGVLTIGDGEGVAEKGLVVGFVQRDRKVRFEINREAARDAGIQVSSQLLKLARIVEPD